MDRLGHDLFAGAVFAQNQHGQIGVGHAADDRPQGLDGRTLADHPHLLGRFARPSADWPSSNCRRSWAFSKRHGGVAGQLAERLFVVLRERAGPLVDHLERAEQLARAASQRNAQQRVGLVAKLRIDVAIDGLAARWRHRRGAARRCESPRPPRRGRRGFATRPPAIPTPAGRPACGSADPRERCSPDRPPAAAPPPRPSAPTAARSRGFGSTGWRFRESLRDGGASAVGWHDAARPRASDATPASIARRPPAMKQM